MRILKPLAAVSVSCLMLAAGTAAWAQGDERESCIEACQRAKAQCIDICDTHENPVQCDQKCQEADQDCIRECR